MPSQTTGCRRYNVQNGQLPLTFEGCLIGEADSFTGDEPRWTELKLYRVSGSGRYILERIGRSDVYHSDQCRRRNKGEEYPTLKDALGDRQIDDFEPCAQCKPTSDTFPVWVEVDLFTATVHESAQDVMEALYHRNPRTGQAWLSRVSQELLVQAAKNDEDIAKVLRTPIEIT